MVNAVAASFMDLLMGWVLSPDANADNRLTLQGLTFGRDDAAARFRVRSLDAAALRIAYGPLILEIESFAMQELDGRLSMDAGKPTLLALQSAGVELSGVRLGGPIVTSKQHPAAAQALRSQGGDAPYPVSAAGQSPTSPWCLGPLGSADGSIRAKIVDAHLLFDADVTVPIRHGQVNFNHATVEHVGPDSRMGVSRLGLYVDAPNGRSYLYQFASAPLAGVEFEKRGALLSPWVSERGKLWLQPFGEALLRQGPCRTGGSFTEQARQLFDRTALSGDVQLADGSFTGPGVRAELVGRSEGRNAIRVHSQAVGRGLTAEIPWMSLRNAVLGSASMQLHCDEIAAGLRLQLLVEDGQLRFEFQIKKMTLTGLRLTPGSHDDRPH